MFRKRAGTRRRLAGLSRSNRRARLTSDSAQVWRLLGFAHHAREDYAAALPAHLKAAELGEGAAADRALYAAAGAHARLGAAQEAFAVLQRLHAGGGFNLTGIALDPGLESLRDDPRFAALLPDPATFADPFVEPVRVLHEWVGEAQAAGALLWQAAGEENDQLGLGIEAAGDVDGDGVGDVIAGAPGGDVAYVYSGRDGAVLLRLAAAQEGELFGRKVSDVGDLDGDGHDDLVVGAWQHAGGAPSGGKVYLHSGKDGGLIRAWTCKVPGDTFGFDATGMGDVAGDGEIDFLLTSAWSAVAGARSGRMFLLAGR